LQNPNYYTANFAQIADYALRAYPEAQYIAVFSDDIVLPDNFSETVAQRIAGLDNVGIYSAVFNSHHEPTRVQPGRTGVEVVPFVEFTAPIIRRDVLEALLLEWPYKMVLGWGLDFWACIKARELGTLIYADHDVVFFHEGAKTNEVTSGNRQQYYDNAAAQMHEGMIEAYGPTWPEKVTEGFPQRLPDWMYTPWQPTGK
jgi:GT2 family glycosyltransferase